MSEPIHNPSAPPPTTGFTLLELMVAMALSLVLFALAFTLVQQLDNTADVVGSMSDVNENLRAAVNMVSRDLSLAGENIPLGGIPLPYGNTATAIKLPNPAYPAASPWTTWTTFPAPPAGVTSLFWPVITAGNAQGPTQGSGANAITTDIVTIISVNQTSLFNQTAVDTTAPNVPTISSGSATITVTATAAGYVQPGQLIMLTNINGSCLLAVSSVSVGATTGVITFKNGDTTNDLLGVNQFSILSTGAVAFAVTSGPASGTISQLQTATQTTKNGVTTTAYSWPTALTAYPITMVTYYLDTSTPQRNLMRLTTSTPVTLPPQPQAVALGIDAMQIQYSLSPPATLDGVQSDPTENPWPTTTDTGNSPNNIRKVVLMMIAENNHQNHANGQWYSKEIKNAVTVQNLDYHNKYNLGASLTAN
jgi:prepilin-type N-terminal cleavage/methylation domain-containing protein